MIAATAGVPPEAVMHVPNGGQRSARAGAYLKAEGAVPGYPDIMVFAGGVGKAMRDNDPVGLAVELKIWSGKPSPEQLSIHAILKDAGWHVFVAYGIDEVGAIAKAYFGK